jgi:DNA-binding transcriptional regulator YhcF (GntR family)
MAHDRSRDDVLPSTHEFLAPILGVRRAGVSESLQSLKRQDLIATGRNQILVLDRRGIEKAARNAYGLPEKEYRRLIGQVARGAVQAVRLEPIPRDWVTG